MGTTPTGTATAVPVTDAARLPARRRWWTVEVAPGAYARVVAWSSSDAQLAAIDAAAAGSSWRAPRRASFVAIMRELVAVADPRTGRDVTVSAATLAQRAGVSVRTVFRRLADARTAGLLVNVARGRHTTRDERTRARETTGRRVHRFATVRALTHPADVAAEISGRVAVTPTRSRRESGTRTVTSTHQRARRASTTSTRRRTTAQAPRPLAVQRHAGRLAARWPWLAPDGRQHVGAVADVLARAGLTDREAVELVDTWHVTTRRTPVGREARRPVAWLAWVLAQARAAGLTTAAERAAAQAEERTAREAARAARYAAEEQARATARTPAAIAARLAIRATIDGCRQASRAPGD